MWTFIRILMLFAAATLLWTQYGCAPRHRKAPASPGRKMARATPESPKGPSRGRSGTRESGLDARGNNSSIPLYTFDSAPVAIERGALVQYTLPNGGTHWYEAVFLPEGGINWVQARDLAEQAGGYLASIHSEAENAFVFSLIDEPKYWYKWDGRHNHVQHGPFLGGYQPEGADSPAQGWRWVSGEPWTYDKWCRDGVAGDRDPRPNDQPNDATGNQDVTCFGEVTDRVAYWGDFPHRISSFNDPHDAKVYGFIIEYDRLPGT